MMTEFPFTIAGANTFRDERISLYENRSSNVGPAGVGRFYFCFLFFRTGAVGAPGEDSIRRGGRERSRDRARVSRHSLRGGAGGRFAVETADAGGEVGRGAQGYGVWIALHADERFRRYGVPRSGRQRRLLDTECVGAGEGAGEASGDGLDLWWRVCGGRDVGAAAARRSAGAAGPDCGEHELPAGHFRIFCASGAGKRIGAPRGGKLWAARSDGGAALGA